MDRQTVYPGAQPLETDILSTQRFLYEALGLFLKDFVGTVTGLAGLPCTPSSPPALTVQIGPGRMYTLQNLEPTAWGQFAGLGGLPADTNPDHQIVKQGILRDTTTLAGFAAPATSGQSINYLIEVAFQEVDGPVIQRVFFNTQNPDVPLPSDVTNFRQDQLLLQVKAGTPAASGSQVTPTVDTGFVPVWVVTVANGQTTITSGNIVQHPSAPLFVLGYIPSSRSVNTAGLATGGHNLASDVTVTVPPAAASDVRTGTDTTKAVTSAALMASSAFQPLTDATTIAWNLASGYNATVTLSASGHTIGAPTNLFDGQNISLEIVQGAGGSFTVNWNAIWDFGATGLPTLQATAGKADRIFGQYNARTGKIEASYRKGV